MKRDKFLKLLGISSLVPFVGLPKDKDGYYIDFKPETPLKKIAKEYSDSEYAYVHLFWDDEETKYDSYKPQKMCPISELMEAFVYDQKWENKEAITFPRSSDLKKIWVDSFKVSSKGKYIFWGKLSQPLEIWDWVQPEFPIGELLITRDQL